ncbi:MAG: hypothetical protein ABSD28_20680 [Tepidisphaeraceae bacterium]|jgi:hypothetical protein
MNPLDYQTPQARRPKKPIPTWAKLTMIAVLAILVTGIFFVVYMLFYLRHLGPMAG